MPIDKKDKYSQTDLPKHCADIPTRVEPCNLSASSRLCVPETRCPVKYCTQDDDCHVLSCTSETCAHANNCNVDPNYCLHEPKTQQQNPELPCCIKSETFRHRNEPPCCMTKKDQVLSSTVNPNNTDFNATFGLSQISKVDKPRDVENSFKNSTKDPSCCKKDQLPTSTLNPEDPSFVAPSELSHISKAKIRWNADTSLGCSKEDPNTSTLSTIKNSTRDPSCCKNGQVPTSTLNPEDPSFVAPSELSHISKAKKRWNADSSLGCSKEDPNTTTLSTVKNSTRDPSCCKNGQVPTSTLNPEDPSFVAPSELSHISKARRRWSADTSLGCSKEDPSTTTLSTVRSCSRSKNKTLIEKSSVPDYAKSDKIVTADDGCLCRFPPAFAQFSCTGKIGGTCRCDRNKPF